jgi:hypothetical protein
MMSAREFASKYPGQVVKLTSDGANYYGVSAEFPIGIVVGYRNGTMGIPGSSKVVVWRDKLEVINNLEPKTGRNYNSVVLEQISSRNTVYFLSVNQIELVTKLKPVTIYPNTCKRCGSSCRNGASFIICSNEHCKANKIVVKSLGILKVKTTDKELYVLCPFCQSRELGVSGDGQRELTCVKSRNHKWNHSWKNGQKLLHNGLTTYVWKDNHLVPWR